MRSELQYNLQKARALATELRITLEAIHEMAPNLQETGDFYAESCANEVGSIESCLDDDITEVIGEGSVKLTVEPFQ